VSCLELCHLIDSLRCRLGPSVALIAFAQDWYASTAGTTTSPSSQLWLPDTHRSFRHGWDEPWLCSPPTQGRHCVLDVEMGDNHQRTNRPRDRASSTATMFRWHCEHKHNSLYGQCLEKKRPAGDGALLRNNTETDPNNTWASRGKLLETFPFSNHQRPPFYFNPVPAGHHPDAREQSTSPSRYWAPRDSLLSLRIPSRRRLCRDTVRGNGDTRIRGTLPWPGAGYTAKGVGKLPKECHCCADSLPPFDFISIV
jgi:hypothetical protein